jgi:hypothetical protein
MPSKEVWFSVDIEADGPIPGPYSMVSIGACAAGVHDGRTFSRISPDEHTFHAMLKPISDQWDPEALAVSGFSRRQLQAEGQNPEQAMHEFVSWVQRTLRELDAKQAVFSAYPLGFDWLFTYWYLMRFAGRSPFSHGRHVDMKTLYAAKANTSVSRSTKRFMPKRLLGTRRHTHNALDDAQGQADLLANLMEWDGRRQAGGQ